MCVCVCQADERGQRGSGDRNGDVYTCVYTYIYVYVYIYVCVCIFIFTNTQMHIHDSLCVNPTLEPPLGRGMPPLWQNDIL